jgi:hypothetical protein
LEERQGLARKNEINGPLYRDAHALSRPAFRTAAVEAGQLACGVVDLGRGSGLLTMEQLSAQTRSATFPYPGSQGMDKERSILAIAASGSLALAAGFYPYSRKRGCYNGRKEW